MMNIDTVKINLPLRTKFVISKGAAESKTNLLTILNNRYIGEASGSIYYGPSLEEIENDIRKGIELLKGYEKFDIHVLYDVNSLKIHPAAKSALLGMLINYASGESKRYPWEVVSLSTPVGIKSSITISLDEPDEIARAIEDPEFPI